MVLPVGLIVASATELGKLGLQMWFQSQRMQGKTKEEQEQDYARESVEFDSHHPDTWGDVPEDDETEGGPE